MWFSLSPADGGSEYVQEKWFVSGCSETSILCAQPAPWRNQYFYPHSCSSLHCQCKRRSREWVPCFTYLCQTQHSHTHTHTHTHTLQAFLLTPWYFCSVFETISVVVSLWLSGSLRDGLSGFDWSSMGRCMCLLPESLLSFSRFLCAVLLCWAFLSCCWVLLCCLKVLVLFSNPCFSISHSLSSLCPKLKLLPTAECVQNTAIMCVKCMAENIFSLIWILFIF